MGIGVPGLRGLYVQRPVVKVYERDTENVILRELKAMESIVRKTEVVVKR